MQQYFTDIFQKFVWFCFNFLRKCS